MGKIKKREAALVLIGLAAGILLGVSAALLWIKPPDNSPVLSASNPSTSVDSETDSTSREETETSSSSVESVSISSETAVSSEPAAVGAYPEWSRETVYNGGDQVLYQNRIYRAKWWTEGEIPGQADVWEDTLESPAPVSKAGGDSAPPPELPAKLDTGGFRVVGYYPSWKPEAAEEIRYDVLTHVVYAFAIPTSDGGLRPLDNPGTAAGIIRDAHANGVKVLIAVGGWSYNDIPLEGTFAEATETPEKRRRFADAVLNLCDDYGFDGVDMDWEHPRVDTTVKQYEELMLTLAEALHKEGKVLTSAVISGATPDGNIYYDAAAHSDSVLSAVDWIHVMAYDGGEGDRHSPYDFAVQSAEYWRDARQVPGEKITLGVPFYGRPSWAAYKDLLAADSGAWNSDTVQYNGMEAWYNGVETIKKKTRYAVENLGGMMIWEITQDAAGEKSLQTAIRQALEE